ncbi:MAG TPA: transcription termination/antitermination NusG family protein [Candidatus Synoicihabitans sp.]|nr:transcription termination/antitermination NusG family protein [Candidatus Synoicihabitans sp.]
MSESFVPAAPPLPEFTRASGEAWCVAHTKARREKKFADLLCAERLVHYLPLLPQVHRYGGRTRTFQKPLFPGYVFVRVPTERRARLFQQDLLARVLPIDDEERFLGQLEDVRRIVSSGLEATLHPLMRRGTPVRVVNGPLRGLEGTVDDPANPRGIVLTVDVLQQGLLVAVPLADLKLLAR